MPWVRNVRKHTHEHTPTHNSGAKKTRGARTSHKNGNTALTDEVRAARKARFGSPAAEAGWELHQVHHWRKV